MRICQIYFDIKFLILIIHFMKIKEERKVYSVVRRVLSLKFFDFFGKDWVESHLFTIFPFFKIFHEKCKIILFRMKQDHTWSSFF